MTFVDLQENDQVLFVSTVSHTGLFCFYHSECRYDYYVLVSYLCSLFKNQKGNRTGDICFLIGLHNNSHRLLRVRVMVFNATFNNVSVIS